MYANGGPIGKLYENAVVATVKHEQFCVSNDYGTRNKVDDFSRQVVGNVGTRSTSNAPQCREGRRVFLRKPKPHGPKRLQQRKRRTK